MAAVPHEWAGPAELLQTAVVGRRYYIEGRSKSELAEEFGLSRFKIARMLDKALTTGVVRITVAMPATIDAELSDALASAWGLRHATVVQSLDGDEPAVTGRLGQAGAQLLTRLVSAGEVLGVASGRTMTALAASLTHLASCTTVPLTGVLTSAAMTETVVEMLRRFTVVSGGSAYPLYAPWVVSDAATARAIRQEPDVADALRRHDYLTTALVAVGSCDPPDSMLLDAVGDDERARIAAAGARAEVCGILVGDDGRVVRADLSDRLLAIRPEQLARVPHVIAVAGGRTKHRAILAALRTGFVHSLVTDGGSARFLLEHRAGLGHEAGPAA